MHRLFAIALVVTALAGCAGQPAPSRGPVSTPAVGTVEGPAGFTVGDPVRVSPPGAHAYEPGIEVGPDGRLIVTAAKGPDDPGTRLSSWLWSSPNGTDWADVPSPANLHHRLPGLEGEIAIDDAGRLYFVDTSVGDSSLSVWRLDGSTPRWERTQPVLPSMGADDRPWLAAHGDGKLYYVASNLVGVPLGREEGSRIWFHRSGDGGRTWERTAAFSDALFCEPASSQRAVGTVYVGCSELVDGYDIPPDFGGRGRAVVHASTDGGRTWTRTVVGDYRRTLTGASNWATTATDRRGVAYHAWIDDAPGNGTGDRVRIARSADRGRSWDTLELAPIEGRMFRGWVCAGPPGRVAYAFYGQPDGDDAWYPYVTASRDAAGDGPDWTVRRLDDRPVGTNANGNPPADFFECAIGPEGTVHTVYARNAEGSANGGIVSYVATVPAEVGRPDP